jgi:putative inorganic carbon (hco3(-)) transporter
MAITDHFVDGIGRRRMLIHALSVVGLGTGIFVATAFVSSNLLIAGFALAAVLAMAMWKPDFATLGAVFALWANLAAAAVRFHHIPAIAAAASFLLLGLPLFYYVVIRREPVRTNGVLGLMLVYFVVQVASAEFSADITASFSALSVFSLQGIILYFLILNTVRTPALLQRCLWAMILAGVLLGTLSLVQRITHTYRQDYAGFAVSHEFDEHEDDAASVEGTEDRTFLAMYPNWRARGSIGDPNYYAQIMIVLVPIALLRLWANRSWLERIPALLALATIVAGVVLSDSRGGTLALCALLVALIVLQYLRPWHVLPVTVAVIIILATTDPMFIRRVQTLGNESGNPRAVDRSILLRRTYLIGAWHMFLDHPLLGVGFGQSPDYLPRYGRMYGYTMPPKDAPTHNLYFQILCETGIVGFAAFLLILWAAVKPMFVLRGYWAQRRPEYAHTLASLMLALLGFLVTSVFLHLSFTRYLYLLLGLCGAATAIYSPQSESPAPVPLRPIPASRSEIGAAWYEA